MIEIWIICLTIRMHFVRWWNDRIRC